MLVNAVVYKDGVKIKNLEEQEIKDYSIEEGNFLWIALLNPTEQEILDVFSKANVHELAMEDLHHGNQIPKIEEYEESVFAVVKQIEIDKVTGNVEVGEVYLFAGDNYLISIRKGVGKSFNSVRKVIEKNQKLLTLGSGYILYSLIDAVVDRYFPIINDLENELDSLENQVFDTEKSMDGKGNVIQKLHQMKSKIRVVKNCVSPLLDSIHKLFGGRVPNICENLDNYYRDTHDHLLRMSTMLDTLLETATSSIQTSVAMITIEENKITKKLASWAAIFATVTFMAGIWGMNFKNMPELDWKYGYPTALLSMVVVAFLIRKRFKKAGWV